jgi:hypothetical protein
MYQLPQFCVSLSFLCNDVLPTYNSKVASFVWTLSFLRNDVLPSYNSKVASFVWTLYFELHK